MTAEQLRQGAALVCALIGGDDSAGTWPRQDWEEASHDR